MALSRWRPIAGAVALALLAGPAAAVTPEEFQLRNGTDLVAVCSVTPEDALATAALHFCQGFGVGVYRTMVAMTTREGADPVLCPPTPPPSRNETLGMFLAWAQVHPARLSEPAADVFGRFLVERFGCTKRPPKERP